MTTRSWLSVTPLTIALVLCAASSPTVLTISLNAPVESCFLVP